MVSWGRRRLAALGAAMVALVAVLIWALRRYRQRVAIMMDKLRYKHIPVLVETIHPDEDFIRTLFRLSRSAQNTPNGLGVIKSFGNRKRTVILLTKPEHVTKVLANSTVHGMGLLRSATQSFVGKKSLFALEGDEWRTQRVIMRSALHSERAQNVFTSAMESVCFRMVTKLAERIKTSPIVDAHAMFARMHVAIIAKSFFGEDFGFFRQELYPLKGIPSAVVHNTSAREEILDAFEYLLKELPKLARSEKFKTEPAAFEEHDPNWSLYSEHARVACRNAIRKRLEMRPAESAGPPKDVLDEIIDAQRAVVASSEDENALIEVLTDDIVQLIFAGFNTVVVSLSFTLFYLTQNPVWWDQVRAEADALFSDRESVRGGIQTTSKLPVLDAVYAETLRLVPPTGFTARILPADLELEPGLVLPRDSDIFLPIVFLAQQESSWGPDATAFNPRRWFETRPPPGAYIPFSAGPRNCIGEAFARRTALTAISMLAHFFAFEPVPGAKQTPRWTGFGYVCDC